jgi:hypothetical protein
MAKEIASAMGEVQYAIVVIEIASQRRSRKSGATVLNRGTVTQSKDSILF